MEKLPYSATYKIEDWQGDCFVNFSKTIDARGMVYLMFVRSRWGSLAACYDFVGFDMDVEDFYIQRTTTELESALSVRNNELVAARFLAHYWPKAVAHIKKELNR